MIVLELAALCGEGIRDLVVAPVWSEGRSGELCGDGVECMSMTVLARDAEEPLRWLLEVATTVIEADGDTNNLNIASFGSGDHMNTVLSNTAAT